MDALLSAASYLTATSYWLAVATAILLAAAASVIPGVSSILVMAIAIPIIVFNIDDPIIGLTLLATIGGVNNTLDSIPAVLMGIPSGPTQVTFLEGNQLAQRGLAAHTLGGVYAVSAMGGIVGAIALMIVIPVVKPFILSFSFPEIAAMALFGVAMVAALSRGAVLKGLAAGLLGILISTIGIDPGDGEQRFVFGRIELWVGLPLIATTIGLFALPEMLDLTMTRKPLSPPDAKISHSEVMRGVRDGVRRWKMVLRQSLFGVFLGAVPGVGANVIDWLSYAFGIFWHKGDRSQFGKGSFDGVLFAESAQNSKEGGQAIPTLTLGVPGGLSWALVMGAMLMYGIAPGTQMLTQYADLTIVLVFTLAIANLGITMLGIAFTGQLAKLSLIPYPLLSAIVIPISLLAAFADMNHWLALPIVFGMGVIGLLMKRYQWPRPPMLLGFILGPIIEKNLQTALNIFGPWGVATRPITIVLVILALGTSYFFYRYMGREQNVVEAPPIAGGSGDTGSSAVARSGGLRLHLWKGENYAALAFIALAAYFVIEALGYPPRAQALPIWVGSGFIILSTIVLARQVLTRGSKQVDIMDIGMRSTGMPHATRTGFILLGLIALFLLVSMAVDMRWGGITYAILGAVLLGNGKWRWVGAAVAAFLVAAFTFGILDNLSGVLWPDPVFQTWLGR